MKMEKWEIVVIVLMLLVLSVGTFQVIRNPDAKSTFDKHLSERVQP